MLKAKTIYLFKQSSDVSIRNMIEKLKESLSKRQIKRHTDPKLKTSAVLFPIFFKEGKYHLLFIQRTERVREHKGQISFPGGAYQKEDGALLNTALREAHEEIGLKSTDVEVLGELDDVLTVGTDYIISPFVGLIPYPYSYRLDKWETEELIEIPIENLLDASCMTEGTEKLNGQDIVSYFYKCSGNKVIWGATARILKQLLDIISGLPVY